MENKSFEGMIVKSTGGLYTVETSDGNVCDCRAKGAFRHSKITPLAGDVVLFENNLSPAGIRDLADTLAGVCNGLAAVFSGCDEEGYNVCLCSRSDDLRQLGKDLNTTLQGRGGGKPGFFQGSVKATKAQIEAFFKK